MRVDNVYVMTRVGDIETVVQVRPGETHDIPSLVGAHVAEVIHEPYVTNYFIDLIRYTLATGFASRVLIPVRLANRDECRTVIIEKQKHTDRVLVFAQPAGCCE